MTCNQCNGIGVIFGAIHKVKLPCPLCSGTGRMSAKQRLWQLRGEWLRRKRMKMDLSLREAAKKYGIDPSNLSKIERGIVSPTNYFKRKP